MKPHYIFTQRGIPQGLVCFQFPGLVREEGLVHAVFTRQGGVSGDPYKSLNIGFGTGDDPNSVKTNLNILEGAMAARKLMFLDQVHGDDVAVFKKGDGSPQKSPCRADAMITDRYDLALMIKQADCQSVILFDPKMRVLANVHCGWRGNTGNILGKVVAEMASRFGCQGRDLMAGIGPSLGPCCAEFKGYEKIFPDHFIQFMVRENYFDLWALSRWQLMKAGLREKSIETANLCTKCRTDLFFSYRAEGVTGRFGTVAMISRSSPQELE